MSSFWNGLMLHNFEWILEFKTGVTRWNLEVELMGDQPCLWIFVASFFLLITDHLFVLLDFIPDVVIKVLHYILTIIIFFSLHNPVIIVPTINYTVILHYSIASLISCFLINFCIISMFLFTLIAFIHLVQVFHLLYGAFADVFHLHFHKSFRKIAFIILQEKETSLGKGFIVYLEMLMFLFALELACVMGKQLRWDYFNWGVLQPMILHMNRLLLNFWIDIFP